MSLLQTPLVLHLPSSPGKGWVPCLPPCLGSLNPNSLHVPQLKSSWITKVLNAQKAIPSAPPISVVNYESSKPRLGFSLRKRCCPAEFLLPLPQVAPVLFPKEHLPHAFVMSPPQVGPHHTVSFLELGPKAHFGYILCPHSPGAH